MNRLLVIAALLGSAALASLASAQPKQLHVLSSNGMKAVVEALKPQLERAAGQPLAIEFGTSAAIRQQIEGGASFDVAVLTVEVIDELAKANKVAPESIGALGRSAVGIGVRSGTTAPDIRTSEAIKQTLLAAKAPTWVAAGATRARVDKMLATLGIADAVAAKIVLARSVDEAVELVTSGKSDLMIMLASEILPAAGTQYAGPLPGEFASYVSFAAAVSAASSGRPAAERVIAALRAADTASVYASKGMELPR